MFFAAFNDEGMFENVGFENPTYKITFIFKVVEKYQLHTLGTK
jgi:hypothetical protein